MKILQTIKERRSIRKFQNKEIPDEMVGKLIDALIWAPSAGNLQSRKFYFVTDSNIKNALSAAALQQTLIKKSPLVVVGCTDNRIAHRYSYRGVELYSIQDVACSLMCMMLAAHEMGLGSVWVGAFHEDEASQSLNLPQYHRPVAIVPVGWPDESPSAPRRVSPEQAIVWM